MRKTHLSLNDQSLKFHKLPDNVQVDKIIQEFPEPPEQTVGPQASQEDDVTTLKRSTRTKRSVIPSDYEVYLQEHDHIIGFENDPDHFYRP